MKSLENKKRIKKEKAKRNAWKKTAHLNPNKDAFLESYAWKALRMKVLVKFGSICQCCGASAKTGEVINVDHIKPRIKFPELALDFENLQVLCSTCNRGKGNWDETDWRPDQPINFDPIDGLDTFLKSL